MEILPIKSLIDEDTLIFGSLNVSLAKLSRIGLPVVDGVVISPPELHLKTLLEHYDFGSKEVIEQSLTLIKKEVDKTPIPEELIRETEKHDKFFVTGVEVKSAKNLWIFLLNIWIEQIKEKLWKEGFKEGLTENLESQVVIFVKKLEASGLAFYDKSLDEVLVNISFGRPEPKDLKKLDNLVLEANKKLMIPHAYEWILDGTTKLVGVKPYIPSTPDPVNSSEEIASSPVSPDPRNDERPKTAVKVFFDLSTGLVVEKEVDGVYIQSEKIFDLNKPRDSFEDLVFRLVESAQTFSHLPILFKLADKSEGMGKIRGTLRLLHQQSLLDPILEAADFVRHKKGLNNIHLVIPFVRSSGEFLKIKRELAGRGLSRKSSMQLWLEVAVPENIVNLETYLEGGLDGVILNIDELIAHLNGFDHTDGELTFYKNEASGLIKFLEDGLRLLHKVKIPFIAQGSVTFYPSVLEFLVEKGVHGVVFERYEVHNAHDILHQAERRMILRRAE